MTLFLAFLLPALLALFPFKLSFLAFFFLIPLFIKVLDEKSCLKKTFLLSFAVGLLYYGVAYFWISKASFRIYFIVLAMIVWILPFYCSAIFVLFRKFPKLFALFAALLFWWGGNRLLSYTPIEAHAMEYPFLTTPLSLKQIIKESFLGFGIIQLLLIGFQLSIATWVTSQEKKKQIPLVSFFAVFIAVSLVYGASELAREDNDFKKKVALIQHNLPISPDWRKENQEETYRIYRQLAQEAKARGPELVVFPLYTLPEDQYRNPELFAEIAKDEGVSLLAAAHVPVEEGEDPFGRDYSTRAMFFSPEGKMTGDYQAVQKSPEFMKAAEATAEKYVILNTAIGKIGILLCFEDSVPDYAKQAKEQGAEFLLALSNPGHFIESKMPKMYLIYNQLRAIETGLPLLRLSTNGPTAVIDSKGEVLQQSSLNQQEIVYSE